ncbi:unnamed protein product (macronuclear) [Paramecium tetraurelia]|uniref:Uncharacterized protein n=1 Tax=Paramecium tetraurelia TaxID=5888 RepID=A0CXC9_PARTE|nr:uncharacterized protein GSPATT00011078001 [Paramecium tetraurelia]CAK75446.1 unnamed protein product [Paramecium tetraurelia]|eukprot:XP_001442843.1 hypothetical protein (macronuclear) [Paramecium tetraurelia strain d4-2]
MNSGLNNQNSLFQQLTPAQLEEYQQQLRYDFKPIFPLSYYQNSSIQSFGNSLLILDNRNFSVPS